MSIISKVRDLIVGSPLPAPTNGGEVASRPTGQYMRGGRGVTFAGWKPALREAQDDIADAWDDAAARVGDLLHNNGWLAGAVDQAVANTVGSGLRLKSIPENETFGMTAVEASEWCKTVERRFELWARNAQECDIQGLRTFGQMQSAAFRLMADHWRNTRRAAVSAQAVEPVRHQGAFAAAAPLVAQKLKV